MYNKGERERSLDMKDYIKWMDGNSKLIKVILALPVINILWWVYRLFRSINDNNVVGIILAIILLFVFPVLAIIDIVTLIFLDKIIWF